MKKEKAFHLAPRSLFDLVAMNDLAQLCMSVKGFNPHDTSPGQLLLSSKQRPITSDGQTLTSTAGGKGQVATVTASMVAFERDAGGFTALHVACAHGHLEMVQVLVEEYHCDINARSDSGKTPLFCAVEPGHESVVRYLLSSDRRPGGAAELRTVTSDHRTIFTVAAEKQHHAITVLLDAALRATGYSTADISPLEAALGGDLFYFVSEKANADAVNALPRSSGSISQPQSNISKIVLARDPAKNTILSALASQRSLTPEQAEVCTFLIRSKLHGEVNEANSVDNTALHNIALSCAESDSGEVLQLRVALLKLLLADGADARRMNKQGALPSQCTENVVVKRFLVAAEKKAAFFDSYVKRNRVPVAERPEFAAACKALKVAYRQAEASAEAALRDPAALLVEGGSIPEPSKLSLSLTVLRVSQLVTPVTSLAVFVEIDGQVVFQTQPSPAQPTPSASHQWSSADATGNIAVSVGDTIVLRVVSQEPPSDAAAAATAAAVGQFDWAVTDATLQGGEVVGSLGGGDAAIVVRFTPSSA